MIPLVQISNKNENELSYFSNKILLVIQVVFFYIMTETKTGEKNHILQIPFY